ncbi:hypothetical protein D9757_001466 [Collybiopsis confluens]|uniref:Uncharacterized protein n=1 Tax=Collybiopsis confluens TaxID=2823264 RepID=A0A8H5MFT1_9AGAR|nr:hypothetical protein D9757_001466 [Collybiopsis confluens]
MLSGDRALINTATGSVRVFEMPLNCPTSSETNADATFPSCNVVKSLKVRLKNPKALKQSVFKIVSGLQFIVTIDPFRCFSSPTALGWDPTM